MITKTLLVVDDEAGTRESLRAVFSGAYRVLLADSAAAAKAALQSEPVDLMLLDITMPQRDGISLLRETRAIYPDIPVIMVTASTGDGAVIEAMRLGAHDYIVKPFDITDLRQSVSRALESRSLNNRVAALENQLAREYSVHGIIGMAPAFRRALETASQLGSDDGPVLVQGEAGSGKKLIARLIHASSMRRQEPFVAMRCADSSGASIAGQIFGEERHPASRGGRLQPGCLDLADGGTLFLGEIDIAPRELQSALVDVMASGQFRRRNGHTPIGTRCRFILSIRTPRAAAAEASPLDSALLDRVRDRVVQIPPLRERQEDIPLLAHYFLNLLRVPECEIARDFEPDAMDMLRSYPWPGNVRELRNVIERLLVVHGSNARIAADFLPREFYQQPAAPEQVGGTVSLAEAVHIREREVIESALQQAKGVKARAAKILRTSPRILGYRMKELHITPREFKPHGAVHQNL